MPAGPDAGVNVPLLADTLREARAEAQRAQTLLARAAALVGGEHGMVIDFPKTNVRLVDTISPDGMSDGEEMTRVPLGGDIRNGEPVDESTAGETVLLPASLVDGDELLLRVRGDALHTLDIQDGDVLVLELRPKGRAANGELVIARIGDIAYIGRWWQKHGRRAVVTHPMTEGTSDKNLKVMAAVSLVIRAINARR
jgi:SOS-response transcriptional repressor LexA